MAKIAYYPSVCNTPNHNNYLYNFKSNMLKCLAYLEITFGRLMIWNDPLRNILHTLEYDKKYRRITRNDSKGSRRWEFGNWVVCLHRKYLYWFPPVDRDALVGKRLNKYKFSYKLNIRKW